LAVWCETIRMLRMLKSKQFWGVLIALILLGYCLKDVRLADLRLLGSKMQFRFAIASLLTSFVCVITRGLRWKLLLSQQKQIPAVRAITLYSAGQVLNVIMPALTGQVGRVFLFARKEGLSRSLIFSTVVLEILFDAVTLILVVILGSAIFVIPSEYQTAGIILTIATAVAITILYLLLHYRGHLEGICRCGLASRWPGAYVGVRKFLNSFTKGIELLRSSGHLMGGVALSLFQWVLHLLVIFFLFLSFGLQVSLAGAAIVMIVNTIVLLVPITPGNAGTFEVVVSTSLKAFSVGRTDAVLCALALHLIDILPIVTLGLVFLRIERFSLREIKQSHEDDIIFDRISEEGIFVEDRKP
jgi:uncharacterized protein (TIRG00374 family)